MTESKWLVCDVPRQLLDFVYPGASERKLRLYACGCCRTVWDDLSRHPASRAVEVAERFADGDESRDELLRAGKTADAAKNRALKNGRERPDHYLLYAARSTAYGQAYDAALAAEGFVREAYTEVPQTSGNVSPLYAALLRDVIGNPYRPVALDPSWRTATVTALAAGIYADRAFDRLPILADALEEAGCEEVDLLAHCRGPGPHARGCWMVDLVLGKE